MDELSVQNSLIFRGQRLVIPAGLCSEMLRQVHAGHLGVTKTIERAKENLFWPGMIKQLTEYVQSWTLCLKHRNSNPQELLVPHEMPERPFQKIRTDIFQFNGKQYLVTTDYYSRYFKIDWLCDTYATTVVQKLMARYSICDILISDNGPQFYSKEFAQFA